MRGARVACRVSRGAGHLCQVLQRLHAEDLEGSTQRAAGVLGGASERGPTRRGPATKRSRGWTGSPKRPWRCAGAWRAARVTRDRGEQEARKRVPKAGGRLAPESASSVAASSVVDLWPCEDALIASAEQTAEESWPKPETIIG